MSLDFTVLLNFWDSLALGALWTIALTVTASVISLVFGVLFAVIALYAPAPIRWPVRAIEWVFMGTPLLLQLFLIYFGLITIGIDLPAFVAGALGLGLHFAVYNSDIIQAGIRAVDPGQTEAARALGLGRWQTIRDVTVPQAVRSVVPPIGNNTIALLKDTALVSVIGVAELTLAAQQAIGRSFRPFEFYLAAAVVYYAINLALEAVLRRIERRISLAR